MVTLTKSTSSLCFYSKASRSLLHINSLTSVHTSVKVRDQILLRDSQEPLAANYLTQIKTV